MPELNSGEMDEEKAGNDIALKLPRKKSRMQDGGRNRQQMSAYNADEIDEEKRRSRNSRAQDIEGE
jgi:hypothetical protein